jgi:hypothetical protein
VRVHYAPRLVNAHTGVASIIAIAVIAQTYPTTDALAAVAVFVLVRMIAMIPFGTWLKRAGVS